MTQWFIIQKLIAVKSSKLQNRDARIIGR